MLGLNSTTRPAVTSTPNNIDKIGGFENAELIYKTAGSIAHSREVLKYIQTQRASIQTAQELLRLLMTPLESISTKVARFLYM